ERAHLYGVACDGGCLRNRRHDYSSRRAHSGDCGVSGKDSKVVRGRVWVFGSNINTDLILPNYVNNASEEEQLRAIFAANRPGWVDMVKPGDIVVGAWNFGTGSSRPAARSLRNAGIS